LLVLGAIVSSCAPTRIAGSNMTASKIPIRIDDQNVAMEWKDWNIW